MCLTHGAMACDDGGRPGSHLQYGQCSPTTRTRWTITRSRKTLSMELVRNEWTATTCRDWKQSQDQTKDRPLSRDCEEDDGDAREGQANSSRTFRTGNCSGCCFGLVSDGMVQPAQGCDNMETWQLAWLLKMKREAVCRRDWGEVEVGGS